MKKPSKITFSTPVAKRSHIEQGMEFECRGNVQIDLRIQGKEWETEKSEIEKVSVTQWTKIKIKSILNSIPWAVIFDIYIKKSDWVQKKEVAYPIALFQHYFREILESEKKQKLLWYIPTS